MQHVGQKRQKSEKDMTGSNEAYNLSAVSLEALYHLKVTCATKINFTFNKITKSVPLPS